MAQKVEYIVELNRVGNGAIEAAQQLKQLDATALAVNRTVAGTSAASSKGMDTLKQSTLATTQGLKAMQNVAMLVGSSTFPQATMAAMVLQQSFVAIKNAAAAAGTSMAAMAAPLAVIAAGAFQVFRLGKSIVEWRDAQAEFEAGTARMGKSIQETADAMHATILKQIESGRLMLSQAEMDRLGELLSNPSNDRLRIARELVQSHTSVLDLMGKEERLSFEAHTAAIAQLNQELAGNTSREERINAINQAYEHQITVLRQLREDGKMGAGEEQILGFQAMEKKLQGLIAIKNTLTDLQQVERAAAQDFASGLSTAIVQFASGTKSAEEAFKQFAATFLQQIAQMILQMLILRAISGIFGASTGSAWVGGIPAAAGGQFGRGGVKLMAGGGIAEVTQPTFFPRFNVIAGEAGREVMTVMARPRLMDVGGIAAQVGDVGPNRLAITNANDLQRLGGGGQVHVALAVHFDRGLEADIIGKSANASVHLVTQKMGERGPLSERTKRLINQ